MMKNLMLKNLIWAIVVALIVVGPVTYFLADRQHPYEYVYGEVLPPDPNTGSQISIHWRVRFNRFCPGWVQRDITDRRGYVWRNVGGPVKNIPAPAKDEYADIVNTLELPRQLGMGPATYQAHVTYRCNWLQRWFWPISVSSPKLLFEIK